MYVYWIKNVGDTDPSVSGYVGVSETPDKRFKAHTKSMFHVGHAVRKYGIDSFEILYEGTVNECLAYEERLRPSENIGWNECKGGGLPPATFSRTTGKLKSDATKKSWTPERREMQRSFMIGNSISPKETSENTKRIRSQNATKRYSDPEERRKQSKDMTGKLRGGYNMTEKTYPTMACPHCSKSSNKHGSWGFMKRWHFDNCKSKQD